MSEFNVGDEIWWIYSDSEYEDIPPARLLIKSGIIGKTQRTDLGTLYHLINDKYLAAADDRNCYKSKKECIDAFKKRLDEL